MFCNVLNSLKKEGYYLPYKIPLTISTSTKVGTTLKTKADKTKLMPLVPLSWLNNSI